MVSDGQVTFVTNLQHKARPESSIPTRNGLVFPEEPRDCPDSDACNYDASAQYEDGGYLPEFALTCDGACVADDDGDGVCNELRLLAV